MAKNEFNPYMKPYKPYPPVKTHLKRTDVIEKKSVDYTPIEIPEGVKYVETMAEEVYNNEYTVNVTFFNYEEIPNPHYERQYKEYRKNLKKYNEEMKVYKEKLKEYNENKKKEEVESRKRLYENLKREFEDSK